MVGKRGPDALVVGHLAVRHGHVEIDAHQDALSLEVDILHGLLVHRVCSRLRNSSPAG